MFLIFFITLSTFLFSQTDYLLKDGDTLYKLSNQFHVPLESLKKVNNIHDETRLKKGTVIHIPQVYQVAKGDTLYSLAKKFKTTTKEIQDWNNLKGTALRVNQYLYLPVAPIQGTLVSPKIEPPPPKSEPFLAKEAKESPKIVFTLPLNGEATPTTKPVTGYLFSPRKGNFLSVCQGTVIFVGRYRELGNLLLVDDGLGHVYGFSQFNSTELKVGSMVKKGEPMGNLDISDGEFLFFAYQGGKPMGLSEFNPKFL